MDEKTRVKNELISKLQTISDDREFLLSVINTVRTVEDRKTVINYIDTGENVTYENVILLSLTLHEQE